MNLATGFISPYFRSSCGQVDGVTNEAEARLGKNFRPLLSGEQADGAHSKAAWALTTNRSFSYTGFGNSSGFAIWQTETSTPAFAL